MTSVSSAGVPSAAGQTGHGGAGWCEGYVNITSAADVFDFANRHCETLDGSLTVSGSNTPDLDKLTPSPLRTITGSLNISTASDLKSIAGLAGLRTIGRSLSVSTNPLLESLAGLESLERVGMDPCTDSITIQGNSALTSIDALRNATLTGTIYIGANDALTSLAALGHLRQSGDLFIAGGKSVTELGLGELEECGDCKISSLPRLKELALPNLKRAQRLLISNNVRLVTLALPQLETVAKDFSVTINDELTSIGGLDRLVSVGTMQIAENPKLAQCFVDALGARLGACQSRCGSNDEAATCP
ncbi:MAG: hypothetical protein ABW061_06765 [Polyangiaceae bacterium]